MVEERCERRSDSSNSGEEGGEAEVVEGIFEVCVQLID